MATIVETIVGDRRVQLSNEEIVRQMSFGSKWNKLRVVARISINGTSNTAACQFVIGVCAGLGPVMKSSNTTFMCGGCFPGTNSGGTSRSLTFNAGSPNYFQSSDSFGSSAITRTGSTNTNVITNGASSFLASTAGTPTCVAVDIYRIGNTYSYGLVYYPQTSGAAQAGNSYKQMVLGADSESGSPWANMTLTQQNGTATNNNQPDCVVAYWSLSSPTLEISDLQVVRFA